MTNNIKIISRPKVRFCQFSDNGQNEEEIVEHCKKQTVVQANGPRIKEILSLKKPIRIVDPTKSTSVGDKDVSLSNCNNDNSSCRSITCGNVQDKSFSDKNVTKVESTMILRDANGIQNTGKSCKMLQLDKNPRDDVSRERIKCLQQKGKENKGILQAGCKEKVNVARPAFKGSNMTKSQSAPSIMKRTRNSMIQGGILNAKPATTLSRVTSRYKTVAKNKISPVKKIVLRNVSGPKIKTSVGPGVFRKKQNDTKASDGNERRTVTSDVEDLAQPEYNSIVCTVNKLKELEQQKIVTDVSHLSSTLKSFLNGKISTALDFPLDEAIYKNLVDLSIDERQLPSTVMRSKDPEPRQKDVVPKLSDFFIPEDTKEICEAVHVKSRVSKINDNWNAFKISDRILEWKYSIDEI
ncbi:uncharacterized protein [Temnothorax longispinosus]|uniref:Protein phosphatase 1 regulatory subunit 35 C-terminal domain-containing protein n=1 Tax=Temnothorax longispinosus TaxID=300112 RepID=A0A4S2L2R7_9HYME|nr:Uncharacterized protein DBV15_05340 [Temnothorax longispinosus]